MLHNSRKIAVLLAAYNGTRFLPAQLDSILAQTFRDFTLYVRDDGSTDATVALVRDYAARDERVVLVEDGELHKGSSGSFLALLDAVDSELYMFSDQDDVWLPEKIEKTYNAYRRVKPAYEGKPVIVHSDAELVDEDLVQLCPSYWRSVNLEPDLLKSYAYLALCNYVQGATMLFDQAVKDLLKEHPWYGFLQHDFWLATRTLRAGGWIESVHEPLIRYRQHRKNEVGVRYGETNRIASRAAHLPEVMAFHWERYRGLRKDGYGPLPKYLWYKLKLFVHLRLKKHYD